MNCAKCGAAVQLGSRFCPGCGAAVGLQYCIGCGSPLTPDVNFCPNCGKGIRGVANPAAPDTPPPPPAPAGIASDLKDLVPGEAFLMDTGHFPITYVKNMMSSTNGKLYLTNRRLVFKAGALQGVGGVYTTPGLFIPNPKDAQKSKEYFAIPLSEITGVESGWANVTVQATGQKYKFGGMRKTKEWQEAINNARTQVG